jgi:folate-binding protein YgfZ
MTIIDPRAYIQLSGPDSRKFLQGQVTCDMESLTADATINGAHCTPKGRIIFLFSATIDAQDNVILQVHNSIAAIALASLKKYAVFFKTQVSDISDQQTTQTPQSNLERLRAGSADVVAETSDLFIPQMLNLDALGYISFKKGCYTGQEIVARAHYRGAVKRRMHHLQLEATTLPTPGDSIKDSAGKAIGNIASAAKVDDTTVEVLAVLADKSADASEIQVGEGQFTTVKHLPLPYAIPAGP